MHNHSRIFMALTAAISFSLAGCGSADDAAPEAEATADAAAMDAAPTQQTAMEQATAAAEASIEDAAPAETTSETAKLEANCLKRVAKETGANVLGVARTEFSQAATSVYVNVEGADAPWLCLGSTDGTISSVMYSGSEGAA